MNINQFSDFANNLKNFGANGVRRPEFILGSSGKYELHYIPFEHTNRDAKLVIVGITPGTTQLELAYDNAQYLLNKGLTEEAILLEVKKSAAFGGPKMKPNLLKLLRHFHFEKLLEIDDVETLWNENCNLLHSTSVVPHAVINTKSKNPLFSGSFDEVLASPLMKECFLDCFVASVRQISDSAFYVGLGPCPQAALEWCVQEGYLRREQVLGAFCHPSTGSGSQNKYYLREVYKDELSVRDPVRHRCEWLDAAYIQMKSQVEALLGNDIQLKEVIRPTLIPVIKNPKKPKTDTSPKKIKVNTPKDAKNFAIIVREFINSKYSLDKDIDKVAEFKSPAGQTIYLVKTTSRLNMINVMVHPNLNRTNLNNLNGVDSISEDFKFHSNMTHFPKKLNNGKTETAYGWQVKIGTIGDLQRFLLAFSSVS